MSKRYKLLKDWLFYHGISGSGCTYGAGFGVVQSVENPSFYLIETGGGAIVPASIVEGNSEWFSEVIEQPTEVSKEFVWDDSKVKELLYQKVPVQVAYFGQLQKMLDEFKSSYTTKQSHTPTEQREEFDYSKASGLHTNPINTRGFERVVEQRDWEIVTVSNDTVGVVLLSGFYNSTLEEILESFSIHSVKRLSDGIVFTVGDETKTLGVIKKFELKDGIMYWWNENTWYYLFQAEKLPESTKPSTEQPKSTLFNNWDGKIGYYTPEPTEKKERIEVREFWFESHSTKNGYEYCFEVSGVIAESQKQKIKAAIENILNQSTK